MFRVSNHNAWGFEGDFWLGSLLGIVVISPGFMIIIIWVWTGFV